MSEDRADHEPKEAALHPPGELLCPEYAFFLDADPQEGFKWHDFTPDEEWHDESVPLNCISFHGTGRNARTPGKKEPQPAYDIMVDGSGDGHSIALFPGEEVYFSYERGASNNDAEFNAVILALENLPPRAHARICTDSQVVVWHLSARHTRRNATYIQKKVHIEDLISSKYLKVEIQWIPRKENRADRFLKHYIASLCGAQGREPLHHRVRRLEVENLRLKARLKKAMKMLENRPVVIRDVGMGTEIVKMASMFSDNG